ncbi:MAG: transglycosylase family protein, partial [Nitriliruptoraceae bacterium]
RLAVEAKMRERAVLPTSDVDVDPAVWDRLADCESDRRWDADTGNGYYGGLQFSLASWRAVGGPGTPDDASKDVQIAYAERLLERQGWRAWPSCSQQLGLR